MEDSKKERLQGRTPHDHDPESVSLELDTDHLFFDHLFLHDDMLKYHAHGIHKCIPGCD